MENVLGGLLVLLATSLVAAQELPPSDIQKFVERREGCDHMRGELPDPGEKRRMREVNREIRKLCTGTDKELMRLKKKYATNSAIMQRLDEFEPDIEPKKAALP